MIKKLNNILFYAKVILLLISFTVTLYIMFMRMDITDSGIISMLPLFIPLFGVLTLFVFSFFLNKGNDNLFFNVSCIVVLLAIILIDYRTIFDNNIISTNKINLNYFNGQINYIKKILYLTIIGNLLLLLKEKLKIHS